MPDAIELRVVDAVNGLGRGGSVSTLGEWERIMKEVGAIKELRGVEGDSVVISDTLVLRDKVRSDSGGSRVHAERRECGRRLADGWRGR